MKEPRQIFKRGIVGLNIYDRVYVYIYIYIYISMPVSYIQPNIEKVKTVS